MATLVMRINPSTFSAGGALAKAYHGGDTTKVYPVEIRNTVVIPIGRHGYKDSVSSAGMFPEYFATATLNDGNVVRGAIEIGVDNTSFIDSEQLVRAGQGFKNALADLIAKGIIIVEVGGVAQTALQVLTM